MGNRLFWRVIISHCCIWAKLNMVKMVALWGGRWFSNNTSLLSELLKDLKMLGLIFKSPLGHT